MGSHDSNESLAMSADWRVAVRLIWRMLRRDWRAGELTVLGLALVLAVAALSSVGFLADRVQQGLVRQSHQLLGGDLLLSADHAWPDEMRQAARQNGLRLAESALFPSMAVLGENAQLVEVAAVSEGYPLRGNLRTAPGLDQADAIVQGIPARGQAWPEDRLARLWLGTENNKSLSAWPALRLGELSLQTAAVLTLVPDRGLNALALAPRLMIHWADLPASGLIQPGSRVSWRLHLAGDAKAIESFEAWAKPRLGRGERMESLDNARPEIRTLIERAGRFLRLAALLTVVLAAVAVGLATERYLRRHLDACAVMRCLGASSRQILIIHGGEFVLFGGLATLAGCLLGYGLQSALAGLLAEFLSQDLPLPAWQPWAQGLAVGMTLLVGFVLPPLLRLRQVSTLRVLRREWQDSAPGWLAAYGLGLLMLAGLMIWVAGEWRLGWIVIAGFAVAIGTFAAVAHLLLLLSRWALAGQRPGFRAWRFGVANLRRRWRGSIVQTVALALGLTTLLLLTIARGDLLESWRNRLPPDAPNRFVINLQAEQRAQFAEIFARHGLPTPVVEPMVRGRLTAVNGREVGPENYTDERAKRLVEREFNLSWRPDLPAGNTVVAGTWQTSGEGVSVEQGLADTLGWKLGDQLMYQVAGEAFTAPIMSLRKLDWDSMRVNFFVIAAPGRLDSYPASYITSFHLPVERAELVNDLVRALPNLTVIDVSALLRQIQDSFEQVALAVQALFGLALLAGLIVLYAALQATSDERQREMAVLRALGARHYQLRAAMLAEFAALGALAGLLAALGSGGIGFALARLVFHLPYTPGILLLTLGLGAGLLVVLTAGWWATRHVLHRPITNELLTT